MKNKLSSRPTSVPAPQRDHGTAKKPMASRQKTKTGEGASTVKPPKKRKRLEPFRDGNINELPHNLGRLASANEAVEPVLTMLSLGKRRRNTLDTKQEVENGVTDVALTVKQDKLPTGVTMLPEPSNLKTKRSKANPYGLSPGETPYPDHLHPTPEECREVARLLSEVHGEVKAPAVIPIPSSTVSGCGEVPSILDALIRTILSAATTGTNSSRAFKGLVDKFGLLEEGIGKGSVDWDNVRRADDSDVFEAIRCGGLAAVKSKRIKDILELVYQENVARRNVFIKGARLNDRSLAPKVDESETGLEKHSEVACAGQHVLSLDHLHALSSDDALNELIKYPGVGPKTASCVLLFCMQRPSFAVDTHVFRLCKWLGWVPEKANRNSTYSHCEVRVPNELKYELHQLFIKHGKTCPRCRAATGEGGEGWEIGCPIDHLVKRTGKRKGVPAMGKGATAKRNTRKGKWDESSEEPTMDESEAEGTESAEESEG
ncbi:MAG: hypothetical protein M1813_003992 [Trichoglossum hirsutum]|nr:MAG: hypothetical protein M1813_003992 [Trichoglossum hirsutum]